MQYPGIGMGGQGRASMPMEDPMARKIEEDRKRQQGLQIAQLILGSLPVVGGLLSGITGGAAMATKKDIKAPAVPQPVGQAVNNQGYRLQDPRYYAG